MNKVIYKDEVYYYKVILNVYHSKLYIYSKREGIFSSISPYKLIYRGIDLSTYAVVEGLRETIEDILKSELNPEVMLIDCSKDVVDLYS